jgi:hypothetical protein
MFELNILDFTDFLNKSNIFLIEDIDINHQIHLEEYYI